VKKRLISILFLVVTGVARASDEQNNMAICPSPDELRRDTQQHWWATKSVHDARARNPNQMLKYKWYSTSPSLAKNIDYFAGAQYLGSTEGHIVCLYIPKIEFGTKDFPVLVYFESLVIGPQGGKWKVDAKKQGIQNCISTDPSECPYLIYQPEDVKDPYEALRELN
jgi:hypothetical protein